MMPEYRISYKFQYFRNIEEMEIAIKVAKETDKPVAATMCMGPPGDENNVSVGECAIRYVSVMDVQSGMHVSVMDVQSGIFICQGGCNQLFICQVFIW